MAKAKKVAPLEQEVIAAQQVAQDQQTQEAAKASIETQEPEQQQPTEPKSTIQPYEEWEVKVESKKRMDPETFEVETYHTFEKKGDKPVRVTHIEERHAEVLNSQVNNTKKYFYPKG